MNCINPSTVWARGRQWMEQKVSGVLTLKAASSSVMPGLASSTFTATYTVLKDVYIGSQL